MRTCIPSILVVFVVLGAEAETATVQAGDESINHSPVYAFGIRPKAAVVSANHSGTERKSNGARDSGNSAQLSSTDEYISRTGSPVLRDFPPKKIPAFVSRHERKRQYEKNQKAAKAATWYEKLFGWTDSNAPTVAEPLKNVDDIAKASKSGAETSKLWGHRIGKGGEIVDAYHKSVDVYREYEKDDHRAVKQGVRPFIKETTKFFVGNYIGGKVAVTLMAVAPGAAVSPPVFTILVVGALAWGAVNVTEKAIDAIANRFFHPIRNTARTGALSDDLIDWLGARTEKGFTIEYDMWSARGRPEFIPAELGSEYLKILNTAQSNCLDRANELLQPKWTPFGPMEPKDGPPTLLDLADRIPYDVITKEQLEEYVRRRAKLVVRQRTKEGNRTGEEAPADQIESYVRRALPYIERARVVRLEQWRRRLQRLLAEVDSETIPIQCAPNPAEIDPAIGKLPISFTAPPLKSLDSTAMTKIRWIARRLTGKEPRINITTNWEWGPIQDQFGKRAVDVWPKGAERTFVVDKPGEYGLVVDRRVSVYLGDNEVVQGAATGDKFVEVTLKPAVGTWFVIDQGSPAFHQKNASYGISIVPKRIRWKEETPGSEQVELVLEYSGKAEGKRPFEIGLLEGIDHRIPVQGKRQGDSYVVQGKTLDHIVRTAQRWGVCFAVELVGGAAMIVQKAGQGVSSSGEDIGRAEREHERERREAAETPVDVHHASFTLRREKDRLKLRVRVSVTSRSIGEEPLSYSGDFEVSGTAVPQETTTPQ